MKWLISIAVVAAVVITVGVVYALTVLFAAPQQERGQVTSDMAEVTEEAGMGDETLVAENDEVVPSSEEAHTDVPVDEEHANYERFVVPLGASEGDVVDALDESGFIKSKFAFNVALATRSGEVEPGAYRLAKTMSAFEVADVLHGEPYMKWVVIQEGLRKEEIAGKLAATLGWDENEKSQWLAATEVRAEHVEGVYFPDTYLIPVDEPPEDVAARLVAKFNEQFAPHLAQFNAQNIRWTTGLTFASLVQREASSDAEMPLIAGILWNRLDEGMHLNVDATLQYARGNTGNGWWAPITVAEKELDSPFNTYKYRGLPPHPIANPGIPAIDATLNPAETSCFYYLHDSDRNIHCAETYEEHQKNIEEYL